MELHEAFVRAIRAYYNGDSHSTTNKIIQEDESERQSMTYTKSYFDDMQALQKQGLDKTGDAEEVENGNVE